MSRQCHSSSTVLPFLLLLLLTTTNFVLIVPLARAHSLVRRQSGLTESVTICELPGEAPLYCNCNRYNVKNVESITCFVRLADIAPGNYVWPLFGALVQATYVKISALSNNTLTFVPTAALQGMPALTSLDLWGLNLTTLPSESIASLNRLQTIDLTDCRIAKVEANAFLHLPLLEKVSVQRNNFSRLAKIFTDVPKLKELYLEENGIETVDDEAFGDLHALTYLSLHGNHIAQLRTQTFKGLSALLTLEITNNRLVKLGPRLFQEAPRLQRLHLEDNQISSIDVTTFQGLAELEYIKLNRNKLRSLPGHAVFANLPLLSFVDISSNQFQHLNGGVFHQPKRKDLGEYIRISFRGNDLLCSCSIYWLREALKDFDSVTKQDVKGIECRLATPPDVADQKAAKQSLLDYVNAEETKQHCARLASQPEVRGNIKLSEPAVETKLGGEVEEEGSAPEDSANDDDHLDGENVIATAGVGSSAPSIVPSTGILVINALALIFFLVKLRL